MKSLISPGDIVSSGLCIGCGSCVVQSNSTGSVAKMEFDSFGELKPKGSQEWLRQGSEAFSRTCPFSPAAANENQLMNSLFTDAEQGNMSLGRFQAAYVGHVSDQDYRQQGSSGGMVTWVATELLRSGLIDGVAHVFAADDPQKEGHYFSYRISRTEEEIRKGAKSRYYPTELSQVLKTIGEVPGRYAVIGVPCFIKAVQLLRREDPIYRERICFTLGLFCGHMKSARFIESFAWQMNVPIQEIKEVEFRSKDPDRPASWYNAALTLRDGQVVNRDWWHLADGDWGAGFLMNSACNFCDDVVAETADISFGDAWVEPYASDGKGTNVVVIRSPLIGSIIWRGIEQGQLKLEEVSGEFVEQTQAAGLRQRREGLSYRLGWSKTGVQPLKRFRDAQSPTKARKLIYRMRFLISAWSHRMFWLARRVHMPQLYIFWARLAAALYHGLAYHRGKIGEITKRFSQLNT
jgi:coenzyme F420-reducing hydrogenase beta subunit